VLSINVSDWCVATNITIILDIVQRLEFFQTSDLHLFPSSRVREEGGKLDPLQTTTSIIDLAIEWIH
jgi:hypothetical protein